MSTHRGHRRRKNVVNVDLYDPSLSEGRNRVGTSNQHSGGDVHGAQYGESVPRPVIDVDAIDDEVVESSASAFAEARRKSQRNHGRTEVVDVDLEDRTTRITQIFRNKRRRVPPENTKTTAPPPPTSPPPPKEPEFTCPICMSPFIEETSTKCGHIYCRRCIMAAIAAQGKCPTCRKKITAKQLIRVHLPATTS